MQPVHRARPKRAYESVTHGRDEDAPTGVLVAVLRRCCIMRASLRSSVAVTRVASSINPAGKPATVAKVAAEMGAFFD